MSARGQANAVVIGGEPRVDLLPPEIEEAKRVKGIRRLMVTLVIGGVLIAAAAFGGVSYLALLAQQRLDAENARTSDLLVQQQEFLVVRTTATRLETAKAALTVGASTEINLAEFFRTVQALLPANTQIVTANGDSASPFDGYAQATVPLQPQRIATFNFTLRAAQLTDVRDWLDRLETVEGFADALPGTISLQPDGSFTVAVTMHVDTRAFDNRFAPAVEGANEEEADQ